MPGHKLPAEIRHGSEKKNLKYFTNFTYLEYGLSRADGNPLPH